LTQASLVVAVYNCERYVGAAIESALGQTVQDIELVVVDDGSTDRTPAILDSIDDPRLSVLHVARMGQSAALNRAIAHCGSAYVAILDADDLALPDRIETLTGFLQTHPEIALAGSRYRPLIDENGHPTGEHVLPLGCADMILLLRRFIAPIFHSSIMFRKEAVLAIGGYDNNLLCWKDLDLYVRLLSATGLPCLANIDRRLSLKRVHPGQYFGPENGVRASPEGRRAEALVKQRIAESLGEIILPAGR
jgi:glycosyltransferase involved in cell wall biosynthesis